MASLSKFSPYSFVVDKAYGNHYSYDGNNLNSCKYISLPPLEPLAWSLFTHDQIHKIVLLMTLFKT